MTFELPETDYHQIDPIRNDPEIISGESWKVPLSELEELVMGDEGLEEMFEDVLDQSFRYTKSVIEHMEALQAGVFDEDYKRKDEERTITHEATKATIQAFVRNLLKSGKNPDAVQKIFPGVESRRSCGLFALRLTLTRGART